MSVESIDWDQIDVCNKVLQKYFKIGHEIKHSNIDDIPIQKFDDFFNLYEKLMTGGYCDFYRKKEESRTYI